MAECEAAGHMAARNVEIIVGTYEEFIIGYQLTVQKDGKVSLTQSFTDHSHTGSVRKIAISGKFLISGGSDEILRIFNLSSRFEVGTIMEHKGTITDLVFHGSQYLFSTAEDGNICIFSRGKWECEKTLKAHVGGVTSFAVHPTGKLALSVGKDKSLRTWNLIKGRRAFITNLKTVADSVHWSPPGTHYLVVKGSCVDVYEVSLGQVVHSVDFKEKVTSLIFIMDDIIAVGGDGKNICLYDITTKLELVQWDAHTMRIKSLRVIPRVATEDLWLVSASSDGTIKVWNIELLSLSSAPKLLGEVNTSCRIICMDIYLPQQKMPVSNVEKAVGYELENKTQANGSSEESVKQKKKKKLKKPLNQETNEGLPIKKKKLKKPLNQETNEGLPIKKKKLKKPLNQETNGLPIKKKKLKEPLNQETNEESPVKKKKLKKPLNQETNEESPVKKKKLKKPLNQETNEESPVKKKKLKKPLNQETNEESPVKKKKLKKPLNQETNEESPVKKKKLKKPLNQETNEGSPVKKKNKLL
ncbi:p21-activated protein kinase-interacting protein 1-like [Cherax quadricarinatus]